MTYVRYQSCSTLLGISTVTAVLCLEQIVDAKQSDPGWPASEAESRLLERTFEKLDQHPVSFGIRPTKLIGGALLTAAGCAVAGITEPWWFPPLLISMLVLIHFIAVIVHELGHLVAQVLMGFRVYWFIAGPVGFMRTQRGMQFHLIDSAGVPGLAEAYPVDFKNLHWRKLWVSAGGPIASLMLGTIGLSAGLLLQPDNWLRGWLLALGGWSLAIAALNLYPVGTPSDGGNILRLLMHRNQSWAILIPVLVPALAMQGIRPRDWGDSVTHHWIAAVESEPDDAGALFHVYLMHRDLGNDDRAHACLEWCIEAISGNQPLLLTADYYLEAIAHLAQRGADLEELRQMLHLLDDVRHDLPRGMKAEAAVLLREGRFEAAIDLARRASGAFGDSVFLGIAVAEQEELAELIEEAHAGIAAELLAPASSSVGW